METRYGLAVLAHQDDGRPHGVDDHEDDRQDPVTACAGFAEPSRAMADIMAVPAVSHGRPWFAGAARYPSNAA